MLQPDTGSAPRLTTTAAIGGNSYVQATGMEEKVRALLKSAGVHNEGALQSEELALNKVML